MMVEFAANLTVYVLTCRLIWAGFVGMEGMLNVAARDRIANWACGGDLSERAARWPAHCFELFDHVFGIRRGRWLRFTRPGLRAFAAILLSVVLASGFWFLLLPTGTVITLHPVPFSWGSPIPYALGLEPSEDKRLMLTGRLLAIPFIYNLAVDYLSLVQTRCVLGRMAASRSVAGILAWLLFDVAATLAIAFVGFVLLGSAFAAVFNGWDFANFYTYIVGWADWFRGGLTMPFDPVNWHGSSFIFICSTFLTSVWVWLYALAGVTVRIAVRVERVRDFLVRNCRLRDRPLRVMGGVLVALFTAFFVPWRMMG